MSADIRRAGALLAAAVLAAALLPGLAEARSRAVGKPWDGRLVGGMRLPAAGPDFFTYDLILRRAPDRAWRRWGTEELVLTLESVAGDMRADDPLAPRLGIADLSRPHGGPFGRRYGGLGHGSHQNGLDADVLYPRLDGRELPARRRADVDRAAAQRLLDAFLGYGVQYVFVSPALRLRGPRSIVQPLPHHDNHMHVRVYPEG